MSRQMLTPIAFAKLVKATTDVTMTVVCTFVFADGCIRLIF